MNKSAMFSYDKVHRYNLQRSWDDDLPMLGWVMLNPSTADALKDDPTIRRCIGFARSRGYGGIIVVNIFGFRATKPEKLLDPYIDDVRYCPVGRDNLTYFKKMIRACDHIVAAWGSQPKIMRKLPGPFELIHHELSHVRPVDRVVCLGTTQNGHPRHPLYVKSSTPFIGFAGS